MYMRSTSACNTYSALALVIYMCYMEYECHEYEWNTCIWGVQAHPRVHQAPAASHIWISAMSHTYECRTYEWVPRHTYEWVPCHTFMNVTHMNECHVTRVNGCCKRIHVCIKQMPRHTYESAQCHRYPRVMTHMWSSKRLPCHKNEWVPCHTNEWEMHDLGWSATHSYVTRIDTHTHTTHAHVGDSLYTWMRGVSHMNERRVISHKSTSHATHTKKWGEACNTWHSSAFISIQQCLYIGAETAAPKSSDCTHIN